MTHSKKILHILHESLIFPLVITSLTFAILDIAGVIEVEHGIFHYIELSILSVLWLDLIVRFFLSKEKEKYLRENFMESVAILPFWKYLTLLHFLRLWEMFHIWERVGKVKNTAVKRFKTFYDNSRNRVRGLTHTVGFNHVWHVSVMLILAGAYIVSKTEELAYGAALLQAVSTCWTAGGVGIAAVGTAGKVVSVVLMIAGILLYTMFACAVTTYAVRKTLKAKDGQAELIGVLKTHAERYPLMQPCDAVKLLYQNEFGGGHLIRDPKKCLEFMQKEFAAVEHDESKPLYEFIGNGVYRVHFAALNAEKYPLEKLNEDFIRSSAEHTGTRTRFLKKLSVLTEHFEEFGFSFPKEDLEVFLEEYAKRDYPMQSHSEIYREAYRPAYRIIVK